MKIDHGSPVPVISGVLSVVVDPSTGVVIVGGGGTSVSISNVVVADGEIFPASSVVVTFRVLFPSGKSVVGTRDQFPDGSTTPVPMSAPPASVSVNSVPGSPVPFMVGVLLFVTRPFTGFAIVGVTGAIVSTSIVIDVAGLTFPAGSVAVAVITFGPSASAGDISQLQSPFTSTITVHVSPRGPVTVIVSPGVPVPVSVGVLSFVSSPSVGEVIAGAAGRVLSIESPVVSSVFVFPASSVTVTVSSGVDTCPDHVPTVH